MPLNANIPMLGQPFEPQRALEGFAQGMQVKKSLADYARMEKADRDAEFKQKKLTEIRSKPYENSPKGQMALYNELFKGGFKEEAKDIREHFDWQNKQVESKKKMQTDKLSQYSRAVLDNPNPVSVYPEMVSYAIKEGLPVPQELIEYVPTNEDLDLPKNIKSKLNFLSSSNLTPGESLARSGDKSTPTQKFDLDQKRKDLENSKRFREEVLPGIDFENISSNKEARSQAIATILSSEYGQSSLGKQTIQAIKGGGPNIIDQMAALMGKQDLAETKLTQEESKSLGSVEPAVKDLNKLIGMYQKGDTGTWISSLESAGSKVPLFGQRSFPKAAVYNKHKKIIAERFLRIATGAAAPDNEVATYAGFFPAWGDTPEIAQAAVTSFIDNIEAKANATVSRLRQLDTPKSNAKADKIEKKINEALKQLNPIVKKQEEPKQPKPWPKIGTVINGRSYIGGEPWKPTNWKKVD